MADKTENSIPAKLIAQIDAIDDPVGDCVRNFMATEGVDREEAIRWILGDLGLKTCDWGLRTVLYALSEGKPPAKMVGEARSVLKATGDKYLMSEIEKRSKKSGEVALIVEAIQRVESYRQRDSKGRWYAWYDWRARVAPKIVAITLQRWCDHSGQSITIDEGILRNDFAQWDDRHGGDVEALVLRGFLLGGMSVTTVKRWRKALEKRDTRQG